MKRYSGLFLEVDEASTLLDYYSSRIFFVMGENDSIDDNTPFFTPQDIAKVFFILPGMNHFGYFTKENWKICERLYTIVLQLHIPCARL